MADVGKYSIGSITTVLSTELNSLPIGTMSTLSAAYDNAANLDLYVMAEFVYNWSGGNQPVHHSLYFFPTLDGTNYADATAQSRVNQVCFFEYGGAFNGRIIASHVFLLPPLKGKFALYSPQLLSGQALSASGNTVKIIPLRMNLNG